jgi:hypothetical protein
MNATSIYFKTTAPSKLHRPYGGQKSSCNIECTVCRGIKTLLEYPIDGKKLHGRACYCHDCKRLRCRAQNISKEFNVEWLRGALEGGDLAERLGPHADAVLTVHQPDKTVTYKLSDDAGVEWEGDVAPAHRSSVSAKTVAAQRTVRPASEEAPGALTRPPRHNDKGWSVPIVEPGLLPAGLPGADVDGSGHTHAPGGIIAHSIDGVSVVNGSYEQALSTLMTRRILLEHREFARMYLAVRERLLAPGLTEDQLAVEEHTAAELELHMQELRSDMGRSLAGL